MQMSYGGSLNAAQIDRREEMTVLRILKRYVGHGRLTLIISRQRRRQGAMLARGTANRREREYGSDLQDGMTMMQVDSVLFGLHAARRSGSSSTALFSFQRPDVIVIGRSRW